MQKSFKSVSMGWYAKVFQKCFNGLCDEYDVNFDKEPYFAILNNPT